MRLLLLAAPALLLAGCSTAKVEGPQGPASPEAKAPSVTFTSAFENYRPLADQEPQDWRRANEDVGAAGGDVHGGHT